MLAASMLLGCQESDSPDSKPELSVDGTEYTMPAEGGSVSVKISSNCYWDVTAEDPDGKPVGWITTNLIKKEHIRWISRQIPKCCLVFIEGAMHLDFYKRMEWYYPFIRRFIR